MEEIRLLKQEEYSQAVELADQVFRKGRKPSTGTSYPYSFSSALGQSYGVFEDGELVSFLGLVPTVVNVHPSNLTAYKIGQVCTAEKARGKGYASQLLDLAIRHAERSQASLIFVSGDRQLYQRAECHRYGQMEVANLNVEWADRTIARFGQIYTLREAAAHDWFGIHRLAAARGVAYDYSLWDLAMLIEAESLASTARRGHKVLVAEYDGQLLGWLVCAVTRPDSNEWAAEAIEWAGEDEAVVLLLADSIRRYMLARVTVSIPSYASGLVPFMKDAIHTSTSYPGTVHVVHPGRLVRQLLPYLEAQQVAVSGEISTECPSDGHVYLRSGNEERLFSSRQWVEFLFGPRGTTSELGESDLADWSKALPIPLPGPNGLGFV